MVYAINSLLINSFPIFHFYLGSMSKPIQRYNILSDIVCYLLFFGNNFIVDIITSTKALVPNYEESLINGFLLMGISIKAA